MIVSHIETIKHCDFSLICDKLTLTFNDFNSC